MKRLLASLLLISSLAAGAAGAAELEMISRAAYSAGASQPGTVEVDHLRTFSADGRLYVFTSSATAVVPGLFDLNGQSDVFVANRETGVTRLVSFAAGLPQRTGNGASFDPRISAGGRYVFFMSRAENLTAAPTSGAQIFRHDLQDGSTRLISHLAGQPDAPLPAPLLGISDVSADGGHAAFHTSAASHLLVPGTTDVNTFSDLFLWNESGDSFQLISHKVDLPLETTGIDGPYQHARVGAGGLTAFVGPRRLAIGADGGPRQAYLFDPATGTNRLASPSTTPGAAGNGESTWLCDLSPDGRFVVYTSLATDLVPGQVDNSIAIGEADLFLFDRSSGTVELVSEKPGQPGHGGNRMSGCGLVSGDGRYLLFRTAASDLVTGITDGGGWDLLRRDRQSGTHVLLTPTAANPGVAAGGAGPPNLSPEPKELALSADGATAIFSCSSSSVLSSGLQGMWPWSLRWENGALEVAFGLADHPETTSQSTPVAMSADGEATLFSTPFPGQATGAPHLAVDAPQFVLGEQGEPPPKLVAPAAFAGRGSGTVGTAPFTTGGELSHPSAMVSQDGSKVAFLTDSREICGGAEREALCLFERGSGAVSRVQPSNSLFKDKLYPLGFTEDGSQLLIETSAALAAGDANEDADLYLFDTATRAFEIVTTAASSSTTSGNRASRALRHGYPGAMTPGGGRVVFESTAENLLTGATLPLGLWSHVYLRDRVSGSTLLVSHVAGQPLDAPARDSSDPRISADGNYVLYLSHATEMVPGMVDGQGPGSRDLFLYDVAAGTTTLVSRFPDNPHISTGSENDAFLSGDGRFVVHHSPYKLMPGMSDPSHPSVYRFDRATGINTLVSHAAADPLHPANGLCSAAGMSQNGRFVLLLCSAGNLAPGVSGPQVYVWDGADGGIVLASHREGFPATGLAAVSSVNFPRISPDGSRVFYTSGDADVIPGLADQPGSADVFVWERETGGVELLTPLFGQSNVAGGTTCKFDAGFHPPAAGGENLAFYCTSPSLAPHDNNVDYDLFLATLSTPLFADGFESGSTAAWEP